MGHKGFKDHQEILTLGGYNRGMTPPPTLTRTPSYPHGGQDLQLIHTPGRDNLGTHLGTNLDLTIDVGMSLYHQIGLHMEI